jgi:hypothetical protein
MSSVEGTENNYKITIITSDIKHAGTNSKVYIQLFGDKGKHTVKIPLQKSSKNKDPFERGKKDIFEISTDVQLGKRLKKIK